MHSAPPEPDDDLLMALADVYREQEAAADAAWPSDVEAFVPIEGDEADALFDRVHAASRPAGSAQNGRVLRFPTRTIVAAAIALAAGLLFFVLTRGSTPSSLPDYTLTNLSGDQLTRTNAPKNSKLARYTPGSRVLLVAKPAVALNDAVTAQLHLRQKGRTTRLDAQVELSATGALRVDLVAGESVPMQAGDGELIILLIPKGMSGVDERLLDVADPSPVRRLVHRFIYTP